MGYSFFCCRARVEDWKMREEVEECRERRICEEGVWNNPYGDDDYMQNKSEKVGIKDKEKKNFRVNIQLINPQENVKENSSATAPLLHSDFFKV